MRFKRIMDVPVYDLSLIRDMWEDKARTHQQWQKKERERLEKSALAKINQNWQDRIQCKTGMKNGVVTLLHHYFERSSLKYTQLYKESDDPQEMFCFEFDGVERMELPVELRTMLYLREWHMRGTQIQRLPDYIVQFQDLSVLDIPMNRIEALPVEIGPHQHVNKANTLNGLCFKNVLEILVFQLAWSIRPGFYRPIFKHFSEKFASVLIELFNQMFAHLSANKPSIGLSSLVTNKKMLDINL